MFCKYCGAQLPDGSQFCSNCGKLLGDVDGVTPETAAPKNSRKHGTGQTASANRLFPPL